MRTLAYPIPETGAEISIWTTCPDLSAEQFGLVLSWSVLRHWIARAAASFHLDGIEIQSVDFKPTDGSILFVKLKADVRDRETKKSLPGIALLRGNVVTALIIGETDAGDEYVIGVNQARPPTTFAAFPELAAGMMDESRDPLEKVCGEVWEELKIRLTPADFTDLTALAGFRMGVQVTYASAGILDAASHVYVARVRLDDALLAELQSLVGGNADEREYIRSIIAPYDDAHRYFPNDGALAALFLYERLGRTYSNRHPWASLSAT